LRRGNTVLRCNSLNPIDNQQQHRDSPGFALRIDQLPQPTLQNLHIWQA